MKVKVSELSGAALDWAVAVVEGDGDITPSLLVKHYKPSTDWSEGGPLIEREGITVHCRDLGKYPEWVADYITWLPEHEWENHGETALIAACRAIVREKLGEEIEIPDELLTPA